jgi:hypothetical protein
VRPRFAIFFARFSPSFRRFVDYCFYFLSTEKSAFGIIQPMYGPFYFSFHPSSDNPLQVIHPAPGSDGRPSFTALVANVDSDTAKYIATSRVQTSRQEMIDELEPMSLHCLTKYMKARAIAPKRIIFYRGASHSVNCYVYLPLISFALQTASRRVSSSMFWSRVSIHHSLPLWY